MVWSAVACSAACSVAVTTTDRPMRRLLCAVAVVLAFSVHAPAFAAVSTSVDLDDLTWTELRDRIRAGSTTVLVPIGGTEQSGPHMALGKHNVRAHAIAARIAKRLGDAVVAPTLAYVPEGSINPPAAHMRFTGTISISVRWIRGVHGSQSIPLANGVSTPVTAF